MTLPSSKLESHDELRVIKYRFLRPRLFKMFDRMSYIQREWSLLILLIGGIFATSLIINVLLTVWRYIQPFVPYGEGGLGTISFLEAILLPASALCCIWATLSLDNMILLSRSGISFPFFVVMFAGMRKTFEWSEITEVSLDMSDVRIPRIQLSMLNGIKLRLELKRFERTDLIALMEHMEIFCIHLERPLDADAILAIYDASMPASDNEKQHLSFTQLWTSSLADNFDFTSFLPLEPGCKLQQGRYVVDSQLGAGGFAATYLAKDKQGRNFVLKESAVPHDGADSEQQKKALEFLERESRVLVDLNHKGIAKPLDYFIENGRHYLVIEYLHGQDLRSYVREHGAIDTATVLSWASQIVDILTHVHDREPPIVHRDVTPENLILRSDGSIALIDFGAANEFISLATGTVVGKQAYISPEQVRGKAAPQSDVYGFGATLHFLLTGKDPIALSTSKPKKVNESVSEAVSDFVSDCTRMELKDRLQSSELKSRIKKLIKGGDSSVESDKGESLSLKVSERERSPVAQLKKNSKS